MHAQVLCAHQEDCKIKSRWARAPHVTIWIYMLPGPAYDREANTFMACRWPQYNQCQLMLTEVAHLAHAATTCTSTANKTIPHQPMPPTMPNPCVPHAQAVSHTHACFACISIKPAETHVYQGTWPAERRRAPVSRCQATQCKHTSLRACHIPMSMSLRRDISFTPAEAID